VDVAPKAEGKRPPTRSSPPSSSPQLIQGVECALDGSGLALVNAVPVAGSIGDVFFRANFRNMALLRRHLERHRRGDSASRSESS
jgi:hypothetical protein